MNIILMILMFIIAGYLLGFVWILVFWFASFLWFLMSWFLSLFGIYMRVSGDRMIWLLFLVVCGITYLVFNIEGSNIGYAIFIFLTGVFMLFRSADTWRVTE